MAINHKLTNVIKGRTVKGTQNQDNKLLVNFDDGSTMSVKTGGNTNSAATGGKVANVWQAGTTLTLEFEGGGKWDIPTEEATACVMLRDKDHKWNMPISRMCLRNRILRTQHDCIPRPQDDWPPGPTDGSFIGTAITQAASLRGEMDMSGTPEAAGETGTAAVFVRSLLLPFSAATL